MRRAQLMGLALAGVLALGAGVPVAALAAQGFTGGNATANVQDSADWQQSGTCLWRITDGLLEVKPANGTSGILDGFDWKRQASEITSVCIFPGVTAVASCYGMFDGCSSLRSADLAGLDTSSVRTMGSMFHNCSSLVSVDFGGMDTSSVQSMSSMFNGCEALTSLDLSGFDTTNVNSMDQMFYYCESLKSLDLSGFKTGLVETMNGMFGHCKSLSSLNITGLDLRDATDLEFMFIGCTSLKSIDLSGVRGSGTTNYKNMFFGSSVEQVTADAETSGPDFPQLAYDTVGWIDTEGNTYDAGAYIPSRTATYRLMLNISRDMFESVDLSSTDYTGEPITKEVKAGPSIGADEYEVSYENNLNAGTATIRVTGKGRLVGTLEYQFKINKVSLDGVPVELSFSHVKYDGNSHDVIPTVLVDGRELDYEADFTTDYWNTTDAGTATVVITGTGNYYGTTRVTFQIDPAPLDQSATVTIADQPYTGTGITPGFEVRGWNGNVLTAGIDYQYSFSDNINPGTATLTLTGLRNYSGTLVAHFQIIRQEAAGSWQTTSGRWWWRNADGSYPPLLLEADWRRLVPLRQFGLHAHRLAEGQRHLVLPARLRRHGNRLDQGRRQLVLVQRVRCHADRLAPARRHVVLAQLLRHHGHRLAAGGRYLVLLLRLGRHGPELLGGRLLPHVLRRHGNQPVGWRLVGRCGRQVGHRRVEPSH